MTESRSRALPLAIALFAAVALAGTTIYFGRDEYLQLARQHGETIVAQHPAAQSRVARGTVHLDPATLAAAGIKTEPLVAATAGVTSEIRGVVVDLRPLIDARGRHLALSGELRTLRLAAAASDAEYQRAAALFQDDRNVSERAMLAAQVQAATDRERVAAAESALRNNVDSIRAAWGVALAELAVGAAPDALAAFAGQRDVILQMIVPEASMHYLRGQVIPVEAAAGGATANARFVSQSPSAVSGAVGTTVFLRADGGVLRPGARVTGHVATGGGKMPGVVVPERAVIWHAGRPWVYRASAGGTFVRVPVTASQAIDGGWFNAQGLEPGQPVVVVGAQLLLSEELEYQIRNENED